MAALIEFCGPLSEPIFRQTRPAIHVIVLYPNTVIAFIVTGRETGKTLIGPDWSALFVEVGSCDSVTALIVAGSTTRVAPFCFCCVTSLIKASEFDLVAALIEYGGEASETLVIPNGLTALIEISPCDLVTTLIIACG